MPTSVSTGHLSTGISQFRAVGHLSERELRQWTALSETTWPEARTDPGGVLYATGDQADQHQMENATASPAPP
ncbi:hypothetical protein KBZ94_27365 [Streptomyces sp. RM72]|uniref:hypothetical protein n=1 Tax=Streptomyces sp. RM72 TaxID=1115510 RepID=UPI001B36FEB1|nr:hypothetical protein [Streptomyces sp. RM72]MBQ0888596.1 hypothetical protein [Streptomyces sp. RM72]